MHWQMSQEWNSCWGAALLERTGGTLADTKLNQCPQCSSADMKLDNTLGCMNRGMSHRSRQGITHLYRALIRPHLHTASSFGAPSTGQMWTNWRGSGEWVLGSGALVPVGAGLGEQGERVALGAPNSTTAYQCLQVVTKKMEVSSLCMERGQETIGKIATREI